MPVPTSPDVKTILRLSVPVIVQVGSVRLPVDGVLSLGPGAIVELTKSAEEELDLMVNNVRIGKGRAVKVGENFGIKLTHLEPPRQRIAALGS